MLKITSWCKYMIPDFYLAWTWQKNCIKAAYFSNSMKTVHPSFFPSLSIRKSSLRQSKLCGCFSVSCPRTVCACQEGGDPYQHVLSSCGSQHNPAFQFIAGRHDCPRLTRGLRETHPAHRGSKDSVHLPSLKSPQLFRVGLHQQRCWGITAMATAVIARWEFCCSATTLHTP